VFVLERMIDIACCRHGFDRLELRRRNLVSPDEMPYRNPLGLVYDSGDYPASLQRAAELGDWAGFEARRAEARQWGRCRRIGIANSIELNTGAPCERAEMTARTGSGQSWVKRPGSRRIGRIGSLTTYSGARSRIFFSVTAPFNPVAAV